MYVLLIQVMDDRWEREVAEFGAINITGFRLLDYSRTFVQDFFEIWKKDSISVSCFILKRRQGVLTLLGSFEVCLANVMFVLLFSKYIHFSNHPLNTIVKLTYYLNKILLNQNL